MLKQLILCAIGIIVIFAAAGFSDPVEIDFRRQTRGNAALRSALIPGWGQFFNSQTFKGGVVGTVFFASVGGYFYYTGVADDDYLAYEKQGLRDGSLYADYEAHKQQAVTAATIAAGMWVVAVVDAYIFGKERLEPGDRPQPPASAGFEWSWLDTGPNLRWKHYF